MSEPDTHPHSEPPALCLGAPPPFLSHAHMRSLPDLDALAQALAECAGRAAVFVAGEVDTQSLHALHRRFPSARFWCEHGHPCADGYARGGLLRSLSHAIRSPLGVVEGATDELETRFGDDVSLEWKMLRRGLSRLRRVASTLADVAELEALPQTSEELSRTQLAEATRQAWAEASQQLPLRREVSFALDEGSGAAPVHVRSRRLVRALRELLVNARQHARAEVKVRLSASKGEGWSVEVMDDGAGPGPAADPATWERFVPASLRRVTSDLGLGLSIVADDARALDATLEVLDTGAGTLSRLSSPSLGG